MFLAIPLILTVLVMVLLRMLKAKKYLLDQNGLDDPFNKEMKNLLIILIVFDLSFIVRFIVDFFLIYYEWLRSDDICIDKEGTSYFCEAYKLTLEQLIS